MDIHIDRHGGRTDEKKRIFQERNLGDASCIMITTETKRDIV